MQRVGEHLDICRLSELSPGRRAKIKYIEGTSTLNRRMADIGLRSGVTVFCERKSFLGDPCAYRIGQTGTVVALRQCDAQAVHVEKVGDQPWG